MNIGFILMILATIIIIATSLLYGFREIAIMVGIFALIFAVVIFTRKKK